VSENSQKSKLGEWYYEEMTPSQTILVIEPDGTEHVIKNGDMNSTQGRNLVARMFYSLKDYEAKFNRLNAISKENFDKLNEWQAACITAEKQRDELLAALEKYVTVMSRCGGGDKQLFMAAIREADNEARAAIASVKASCGAQAETAKNEGGAA